MNQGKNISFIEWLHAKGVDKMSESNKEFNSSIRDAGLLLMFNDEQKAKDLVQIIKASDDISTSSDNLSEYYQNKSSITSPSGMKNENGSTVMYVTTEVRDKLCNAYLKEIRPIIDEEAKAAQLSAVKAALEKIDGFNMQDVSDANAQDAERKKQYDYLGKMALLLRNKGDVWQREYAVEAISTALSIYLADNYNLLNDSERQRIQRTISSFSGRNQDGEVVAGLYTDALFTFQLTFSNNREDLIAQYTQKLLYGGTLQLDTKVALINQNHLSAKQDDPNAFVQPRFFSGPNGEPPETDQIVLHAGGGSGHSAERILRRVADSNTPGGARYTYTKVDGGAGVEYVNGKNYPIYTTEITPKYKKVNGKFVELSIEEMNTKDPKTYQSYIEATVETLICSEKNIECYKKAATAVGGNNQGEALSSAGSEDAKQWTALNNIIINARGSAIDEARYELPMQRSGNCPAFSATLTFAAIMGMDEKQGIAKREGIDIGMDFLQQAKTYKHHNVIYKLSEIERSNQDPTLARDIITAARNNEKYNNQDPIEFAIKNDIKLKGLHPIEYAMAENTKIHQGQKTGNKILINGESPFVYGIKNSEHIKIHNKDFIQYYTEYRLQPKEEMLSELIAASIDPAKLFEGIYNQIYSKDRYSTSLDRISALNQVVRSHDAGLQLNTSSQFMKMLRGGFLDLKSAAYEMQQMNVDAKDLIYLKKFCELKDAHTIDLIIEAMKVDVAKPDYIDVQVKNGVSDISSRLKEAVMLDEISQAIKLDFASSDIAKKYIVELSKNPDLFKKHQDEYSSIVEARKNFAKAQTAIPEDGKAIEDAAEKLQAAFQAKSPDNNIDVVERIGSDRNAAMRRYELLLMRANKDQSLDNHIEFLEFALQTIKDEAPEKEQTVVRISEALESMKPKEHSAESVRWVDRVKNSAEEKHAKNWTEKVTSENQISPQR